MQNRPWVALAWLLALAITASTELLAWFVIMEVRRGPLELWNLIAPLTAAFLGALSVSRSANGLARTTAMLILPALAVWLTLLLLRIG
jgi:hypothetical protein